MKNLSSKLTAQPNAQGKEKKNLLKTSLKLHIVITVFILNCLIMSSCTSSSRPSTSAEIAEQMKFQQKWDTEQKEAERKWDSTLKAEQKSESIGK